MTDKTQNLTPLKKPEKEKLVFPYPPDFFDGTLPNGVLSPSGIGRWRKCQRQFEYAYVLGERQPMGLAAAKGKAIHSGAEKVHKHTIATGKLLPREEAIAHVADQFDAEVDEVPDDVKEAFEIPLGVFKDNTLNNFSVYYSSAVPRTRPLAAEKPFAVRVGGVPIRGVIDLIDQTPGEYTLKDDPDKPPPLVKVVVDLKTTKKRWTDQQVLFESQFTIYAIAEDAEDIRVDLLLDQKRGCSYTALRALRSPHEKQIVAEDIQMIAQAIRKGIFPRCDPTSWVCTPKWCGYYAKCRGPK